MDFVIFGKVSMANARWSRWTYSELSFHPLLTLPEYYVNQNDKRTLTHLYIPY
jgi:hypothetical protein